MVTASRALIIHRHPFFFLYPSEHWASDDRVVDLNETQADCE